MKYIYESDILLPEFRLDTDKMSRYATIACDQFTSEPEYWNEVKELTEGSVTTANAVLQEIYLNRLDEKKDGVHKYMYGLLSNCLQEYKNSMIYCERTLPSNGRIRHGVVAAIDLEDYDYNKGSSSPIRSSEETVKERIPARMAIRADAPIELSHVLMFYNDEGNVINGYLEKNRDKYEKSYAFDLMLGSGNIKGYFIDEDGKRFITDFITNAADPSLFAEKYGAGPVPLVMTVGDGNHSLAAAKACYEELKKKYGDDAKAMKARYATVELVNIHDEAIEFEPIYRLIKNCDASEFVSYLKKEYGAKDECEAGSFGYTIFDGNEKYNVYIPHPESALPVGEIQNAIDKFLSHHKEYGVDYIHGVDSLSKLVSTGKNTGVMFEGMKKNELFDAVVKDGALPRKTFSMGEAKDKRFYLEAAEIK